MKKISEYMFGNRKYQESYVKENNHKLIELSEKGQQPKALFIGCVDSRMLPNLITDTGPGDMLVVRNVGNFVTPYSEDQSEHSVSSALEFAVKVLKVEEIIVCGHTQCGAIYTIYSELDSHAFTALSQWLSQGEILKKRIDALGLTFQDKDEMLRRAERESVKIQIENLLSYDFVREAVEAGSVKLHGWIYDIQSGAIHYYDEDEDLFKNIVEEAP